MSGDDTVVVELHVLIPELAGEPDGDITVVKDITVDERNLAGLLAMTQWVGARFGGDVVEDQP
jgi:hypothetical protein